MNIDITKKRMRRGEVYYADLGEIDRNVRTSEQRGIRPVIIIQNDIGNKYSPTVIVSAITSQITKTKLPTHVDLDYNYIGLKKESFVGLEQIRTLDKTKLISYVGELKKEDLVKVNKAVMQSLGLEIAERVKGIEELDKVLAMAIDTNVDNNDFLNSLYKEREIKIQLLKNTCDKVGADFREYYNPYMSCEKVG